MQLEVATPANNHTEFPRWTLLKGLIVAAALAAISSLLMWQSSQRLREIGRSQIEVQSLAAELDHLNEALVFTAALMAATAEPRYEQRYNELSPRLAQTRRALAAAIRLPDNAADLVATLRLDQSASQIERKAIARAKQGHKEGALALLNGAQYQQTVRELSLHTDKIKERSQSHLQRTSDEFGVRWRITTVLLWALSACLIIVWVLIGRRLKIWGSQLQRLHKEAESAAATKAQFLAAMSHEIRTPLSGVLGMADVLIAEDLAPRHKKMVAAIRTSGKHLLAVVNDILDFTRLEAGAIEVEQSVFSLAELMENVTSITHPMAVEKGLTLNTQVSESVPPRLVGDARKLVQALLNLVGNAIKFTERGGVTVRVDSRPTLDRQLLVRFEIEDTGPGIAPEQQAWLFKAFTQADSESRHEGTGLGLAISKRLIEVMGGEIGLTSAPGRGSTFWFEVPSSVAGSAESIAIRAAITEIVPRDILLAEDVELNRQIVRTVLTKQGHSITLAHDGAQAIDLASRQRFDVILMDIQMPHVDGVEATRRILNSKGPNSGTPIIALTANVLPAEQERYLAAGMKACVSKPVDWEQLRNAIAEHSEEPEREEAPARQDLTEGPVLIDWDIVERLQSLGMGDDLMPLLRQSLESARQAGDTMSALPAASGEIARQAHGLKGSCGMLGLIAIAEICGKIQRTAEDGANVDLLLSGLRATVASSQAELDRGNH